MKRQWSELRDDLLHAINMRGVEKVASAIPADRATVYRLVNGVTKRPSAAIRAGVERVVREQQTTEES